MDNYTMTGTENMIEVLLKNNDDFLKVKETLTRIGVASRKERKLYQSCHILHKQGHYFIVHFKELFALDGKETNFSDEDISRRNTIIKLLVDWGLVELVSQFPQHAKFTPINQIKILPFKEKNEWETISKYNIGRHKNNR